MPCIPESRIVNHDHEAINIIKNVAALEKDLAKMKEEAARLQAAQEEPPIDHLALNVNWNENGN